MTHSGELERQRILVTGGAGFIGNFVVRQLIGSGAQVLNLDALTYASAPEALSDLEQTGRYRLLQVDVRDAARCAEVVEEFRPEAVVHLAAETHVDRSINSPRAFLETNVAGTFNLLEASARYYESLKGDAAARFRLIHVSTDEVFGALDSGDPPFTAATPYSPSSPYSASKAAADHLVRAWHRTFGLPAIVTNCSNNFGPWQYPEKFIPVVIARALAGSEVPIYGRGDQIRDWLFVEDHAAGLVAVLQKGTPGQTYLFGARNEMTNWQVAEMVCEVLDDIVPVAEATPRRHLLTSVVDRPGHDARYAIDPTFSEKELGWKPMHSFEAALRTTIQWYCEHSVWLERSLERMGGYRRLGMGRVE